MRFNRTTFWTIFLGISGAIVLVSLFTPLVNRSPLGARRTQCQSNLRQIALAVQQYNQDNSERFPSLRTVAGWRGAIAPYLKDAAIFHCPSVDDDKTAKTADYWFNARLSGAQAETLASPSVTLLLGDGYSFSDPRVALSQLPQSWRDDGFSPAYRHLDGANYAFADGHVKWLKATQVTTQKPDSAAYTFAVR